MLIKILGTLLIGLIIGSETKVYSQGSSKTKSENDEKKVRNVEMVINTYAEDFTLEDYNSEKHSLSDYKDSKAVVLMFISSRCPVSNSYNSRMVSLYNDYHSKKITFVGINANKNENIEEIKKHSKEKNFEFTVLKDVNNVVADKFVATVTPEIYVLNPGFEILYHGRIDDSRREDEVKSQDLRNALDQIIEGKKIAISNTKAFGCIIQKVK